jgi:PAS domain S-box-containing protein
MTIEYAGTSTPATTGSRSGDEEGALSDAVLADAVRQLADAVVIADAGGAIIFWNHGAERLFGWSARDAVGGTLDLIIPERLRHRHWEGWETVMRTGVTRYGDTLLEVPALHRDGRRLSIAFTVTLLTDPGSGRVTAVVAVLRDDTERWQQRRDQRDELTRLRAELAGAPAARA